MSTQRIDPYIEGLDHQKTYHNIYFCDMTTMIRLLEDFARVYMSRWSKIHEEISLDGRTFVSQFTHRENMTWEVKARSLMARMADGLRAGGGGPIRAITSIPYELECDFTAVAERPSRVQLTMQVREHIDPNHTVREFPLGAAYVAPSYLYLENFFGAQLDPFLTVRLAPR